MIDNNNLMKLIANNMVQLQERKRKAFRKAFLAGRVCGFTAYNIFKQEYIPLNEILFKVDNEGNLLNVKSN